MPLYVVSNPGLCACQVSTLLTDMATSNFLSRLHTVQGRLLPEDSVITMVVYPVYGMLSGARTKIQTP